MWFEYTVINCAALENWKKCLGLMSIPGQSDEIDQHIFKLVLNWD